MTVNGSLKDIQIFHTDRGNEFKNQMIEETLEAFEITRSLSHKVLTCHLPFDINTILNIMRSLE